MLKRSLLCLVVALLIAPAVMAKKPRLRCPKTPASEARAQKLAGRLFTKAEHAFSQGRFDRAIKRFLCSLWVAEHENTVLNIAQVISHLDDREKEWAAGLMETYIEKKEDRPTTPEIAKLAAELRRMIDPDAPPPVEEPPAEPPAQIADTEPPPESLQLEEEPVDEEGPFLLRERFLTIAGWSAFGLGGASLVLGIIAQGLSASAKSDAQNAGSYSQFLADKDAAEGYQTGATVGFVACGVFAAAGVVAFWLRKRRRNSESLELDAGIQVSVLIGPSFAGMGGSF